MKMFRSIAFSLAMALGAVGSLALGLVSVVLQPTLRYIAHGCEALANGIDKLDRELAYKFSEDVKHASGTAQGLQRESNGYRQTSAKDEYEGLSPAT